MTALPDPLRVLHVITSTDAGGAERMLLRTLAELRSRPRTTRVHGGVVAVKPAGALAGRISAEAAELTCLGAHPPRGTLADLAWPFEELRALVSLRRAITRFRPHVVQTWLPRADLLGRLAAAGTGVPVLASVRVIETDRAWPARLDGLTRHLVSRWLAVSEGAADAHSRRSGIARDRFTVIPNALADAELEAPPEAASFRSRQGVPAGVFLVACVARLHPQKGLAFLLDALAGEPAIHAAIVGEGPQRAELEERAGRPDLAGRVRFTGRLEDPRQAVAAADAFVLPSLYEGMPGALIEAMALGKACVATAIPGTLEVASDQHEALLVPAADPSALASALGRLREDAELRARLGAAARARVLAEFRMERNVDRLLALYGRILSDAAPFPARW